MAAIRAGAVILVATALCGCIVTRPPSQAVADLAGGAGGLSVYAVGDIADCQHAQPEATPAFATARLVPHGSTVLALGDIAYPRTDASTLASCFIPTWGPHLAHMLAVPGNHDYVAGHAAEFTRYFGLVSDDPHFVAYTRALAPGWLLVALDSNVQGEALQQEYAWLQGALAAIDTPSGATTGPCIVAMWHAPVYSSGMHRGSGEHMRPFWRLLDQRGADLVLNGHEHFYEAFEPMDSHGRRRSDGAGMREFTVGTGGARLYGFWRPPFASRARVLDHGVLELTLAPGSYAWQFVDVAGRVRDAGSARCRSSAK